MGVALSSAGAELNSALKGACEGLSMKQFSEEIGECMDLVIKGDASALTGMLARRGSGKVKHLEVRQLWMQEKIRNGRLRYEKSQGK